MAKLNAAWHEAHRLPRNATTDQRVAWHLEHAEMCGCRAIPPPLQAEIARRRENTRTEGADD